MCGPRNHGKVFDMTTAPQQRRTPLGLFSDKPIPRLYNRLVEVLRIRHYCRRTEEAYIHWIRRFIEFHQQRHNLVTTLEHLL